MDYQLVVQQGRSAAKTIRLADGVTTVGRQDGCELMVRSSQVSRKHCQLFEKKGLLLVKDLGSANGTFVNGTRIEEQRVLEPGDELTVGPIKFRIEKAAATAGATPAPDAGLASGSDPDAKASPTDTAIPEPVEAPIPLDEDDVLSFVIGDDDETIAPASKPAQTAPVAAKKAPEPRAEPARVPSQSPATKPTPKPAPQPEAAAREGGGEADEAIAEFLMGIEVDDDDRR
jgi:predicted component of type VI protein secretion system